MYRDAIPVVVRNHIAEEEFNKDTYVRIFKASDKVYASNQGPDPKPPVAAVTAANQQEVAAASFSKNKKNKNKGGAHLTNQIRQPQPRIRLTTRVSKARGVTEPLGMLQLKVTTSATSIISGGLMRTSVQLRGNVQ